MSLRVVFAVVLLALGGQAWAAGDYFADPKSRCKLWWPTKEPYYDDGKLTATYAIMSVKWNGTCGKGMAQGRGTFEVVEKRQWKQDAPEITTSTGEGDFVDGKLTGRGFIVAGTNGESRAEGEFRDGVLNGRAVTTYTSPTLESRGEGEYRDGSRNGWGKEHSEWLSDGKWNTKSLEGEWVNGQMTGRGVEIEGRRGCKAVQRYEGEWAGNLPHGRGTQTTYSGKVYSGTWAKGYLGSKSWLWDLSEGTEELDKICG